jgi:hypothetical protein
MSPDIRRPPSGRLPRLRLRRPRSRRAAVPLGLVLAVGGAAGAALADIVAPANGGHLTAVSQAIASTGAAARSPVVGRVPAATAHGVRVDRVTYAREDDKGGTLDIFASAERGVRSIAVSGPGVAPARLRGDHGHYEARVRYTGDQAPLSIRVAAVGHGLRAERIAEVDDRVYATAVYDVDARQLTIHASSSDALGRPTLRARGYGRIDAGGVLVTQTNGTPADVRVTSAAGGAVAVPVSLTGRS